MIGVHITDNPYSKEPYHTLWEKGWRAAQREYNEKRDRARLKRPRRPYPRETRNQLVLPPNSRFVAK